MDAFLHCEILMRTLKQQQCWRAEQFVMVPLQLFHSPVSLPMTWASFTSSSAWDAAIPSTMRQAARTRHTVERILTKCRILLGEVPCDASGPKRELYQCRCCQLGFIFLNSSKYVLNSATVPGPCFFFLVS